MRIAAFDDGGVPALGVVDGEQIVHLGRAAPSLPSDLTGLLQLCDDGLAQAKQAAGCAGTEARLPLAGLDYRIPVQNPGKIICLGLNYAEHAAEGGYDKPDYPTLFMRGRTSLTAHGAPIVRPQCSDQLDYEAELVAVIGRSARHVSQADALRHVAGYSCFNDASVRDYQRRTIQWTMGKNFDATGAFGPWFVTADALPPGAAGLTIQSRLNGDVVQHANTADMIFPVAETIALLTECLTLEPGDLVVMGTPSGVGHARKPPLWMKHGDIVEVEIEGIGVLRSPIVDEVR